MAYAPQTPATTNLLLSPDVQRTVSALGTLLDAAETVAEIGEVATLGAGCVALGAAVVMTASIAVIGMEAAKGLASLDSSTPITGLDQAIDAVGKGADVPLSAPDAIMTVFDSGSFKDSYDLVGGLGNKYGYVTAVAKSLKLLQQSTNAPPAGSHHGLEGREHSWTEKTVWHTGGNEFIDKLGQAGEELA